MRMLENHVATLVCDADSQAESNKWEDPTGISVMGGLIRTGMASLDVDFARSIVLR